MRVFLVAFFSFIGHQKRSNQLIDCPKGFTSDGVDSLCKEMVCQEGIFLENSLCVKLGAENN